MENENNKPAEKPLKSAVVKLLTIEFLVVLIILLITVILLIYLNIIPKNKIISYLLPFLSEKDTNTPVSKDIDLVGNYSFPSNLSTLDIDLTAQSDLPEYILSIQNKDDLINLLKTWNVYGNYYYASAKEVRNAKPLEKIHLKLVSTPQKGILLSSNNQPYLTYDAKIGNGEIDLYVNISDNALKSNDLTANSKLITYALISIMYRVTHNVHPNNIQDREKELEEIIKKEIDKNYLVLDKTD